MLYSCIFMAFAALNREFIMKTGSICVIGGGIVGVTTALALAERGHDVQIVEAADELATGTSAQNGAQLSYCYTDALGSPDLLAKMPKLSLGKDDAFRLKMAFARDDLTWLLSFLRNCTADRHMANTLSVLGLAQHSKAVTERWIDTYKPEFSYRTSGKLELFGDAEALKARGKKVAIKNWFGAKQEILNRAQVLALEPALENFQGELVGAVYCPDEAVGDAQLFARAIGKHLVDNFDAKIFLSERVQSLVMKNDRLVGLQTDKRTITADAFVLCGGLGSKALAAQWGEKLPIMAMAGYSLDFPANNYLPSMAITDIGSKTVICRLGNTTRYAGLADLGDASGIPNPTREATLRATLKRRFGDMAMGSDSAKIWVGQRPMTPDSKPIIRPACVKGAFLNCGHGMLGWTLAGGSADLIADQIGMSFST